MTKIAKCDCSADDAYALKNLAASSQYTVDVTVVVPAATLAAIGAVLGNYTACYAALGVYPPADGIAGYYDGAIWEYIAARIGGPGGALTPDTAVTVRMVATYISGNNWSIAYSLVGGGSLFTGASTNLGQNDTIPMPLRVCGTFTNNVAGEIYYASAVSVKNAASTVIFTDDFSSGDFSAWDSVYGAATVINDPFAIPPVRQRITAFRNTVVCGYDKALDPASSGTGEWAVTVNGSSRTVTALTITGSQAALTVSGAPIVTGNHVLVTHT